MQKQSYASHTHHPIPTYIATGLWFIWLVCQVGAWAFSWPTREAAGLVLGLAVFVIIGTGRGYTGNLQDRIVRLEMRLRSARLLPADDADPLRTLSTKQIVALRFASDAELPGLLERAVREDLAPDGIKRAVENWRADAFRT